MPFFMDIHKFQGATAEQIAKAHAADLAVQGRYDVEYMKYWFNESCGKVFCLIHAPTAEAAALVHRESHGQVADKIIEVDPEVAEGFLGGGAVNSAHAVLLPGGKDSQRDPGIRSILFTDIVGSTELTQRIGDAAAMTILHIHNSIVRDALKAEGGREVKHTGDGIMASFFSAVAAVRCATQIQRALTRRRQEQNEHPISVRIGAAAGEPVEERQDLFGSTVQLAARLCSHAQPGQVLVSNVVAELCIGKGLIFQDLGEAHLKGFDRPIRVHSVQLTQAG
jgi:class 3 adenylate cyclase